MLLQCPVCTSRELSTTVRRPRLPVYQNVTYATRAAALNAPQAEFELATCATCGFSFNAKFDAELITYDSNYDNHVASAYFLKYYRDLAQMLIDRLGLIEGTVYDVGCGKGEFLRILCTLAPGIRGIGIDPSCTPLHDGNLELIQSRFDASLFAEDTKLVILRHVLEHIDKPVQFLKALGDAMPAAPLFVEVPDLDWILVNAAYWDFCYEHCNYFTMPSLAAALGRASFRLIDQQRCFGDQYQWALAMPAAQHVVPAADNGRAVAAVTSYHTSEQAGLAKITAKAAAAGGVALWGMATKGVLLSTLLPEASVVGGVDMNTAKQGRFAAGSGVAIHAPGWLGELAVDATVLVMNPNYLEEIRSLAAVVRKDLRIVGEL